MPAPRTSNRACGQTRLGMDGRPVPFQTTGGRIGSKAAQTASGTPRAKSDRHLAWSLGMCRPPCQACALSE